MRKNKGFTLIEVILSIAILGIISIFFLGAMANHFNFLTRTKYITEEIFLAQREMEEEIDLVKKEIIDLNNGESIPHPRSLNKKTVFASDLGGVEVSYYEIEKSLNNKNYFTLVSNVKPDPLEMLALESIDLKLKHNTAYVDYGYATSDFSVLGQFKNRDADKYDHMLNQAEWYVSNEKYNMPMPKNPSFDMNENLDYNSYYFPLFPRDYELIDNETVFKFGSSVNNFNKLTEFGGRHILYTVTPAAKSGKLGEQMRSNPIFISGLPILEDLIMHLDASYVDVTINDEVQAVGGDWFVNKWVDLSSIIGRDRPNNFATAFSNKPTVKRTEMEVGFIGQHISFNENQRLHIRQDTDDTLTVISVVKNRSDMEETEYLKNEDVILKMEANEANDPNWRVELDVISAEDEDFVIGGNNVDIAEMIVYQGILDESVVEDIEKYIVKKYKDVVFTGNIWELQDQTETIEIGDAFELPTMILAEMDTGMRKEVCVLWDEETPDITEIGIYEIRGVALADFTKEVIFTLEVIPKEGTN